MEEDYDEDVIDGVEIENNGDTMSLRDAMQDIAVAHQEITKYKQGGLAVCKAIDERIAEAESADESEELIDVLKGVKTSAFAIYLRVKRGDQELQGDREGKYQGYMGEINA